VARLPQLGGDENTWGQVLNDFLLETHNNDGTLKPDVVTATNLAPNAVDNTALSSNSVTNATLAVSGGSDGQVLTKDSGQVSGIKWASAGGSAPQATTTSVGTVQLAGDLGGTATAPTVPGLAGKEPTLVAGNSTQYYRGDKSWQTLDKAAVGLANVDNTTDANKPISTAMQTALNAKEATITTGNSTQYYRGDKSFQTLDKAAVGLASVDNTADVNKPVSTAMQTALDAKADATALGTKVLLIDNAASLPPGTPAGVIVVVKS